MTGAGGPALRRRWAPRGGRSRLRFGTHVVRTGQALRKARPPGSFQAVVEEAKGSP